MLPRSIRHLWRRPWRFSSDDGITIRSSADDGSEMGLDVLSLLMLALPTCYGRKQLMRADLVAVDLKEMSDSENPIMDIASNTRKMSNPQQSGRTKAEGFRKQRKEWSKFCLRLIRESLDKNLIEKKKSNIINKHFRNENSNELQSFRLYGFQ